MAETHTLCMWQSCAKSKNIQTRVPILSLYSKCCTNLWISIKGGAQTRCANATTTDATAHHIRAPPSTEAWRYSTVDAAMWLEYVMEQYSTSTGDCHLIFTHIAQAIPQYSQSQRSPRQHSIANKLCWQLCSCWHLLRATTQHCKWTGYVSKTGLSCKQLWRPLQQHSTTSASCRTCTTQNPHQWPTLN